MNTPVHVAPMFEMDALPFGTAIVIEAVTETGEICRFGLTRLEKTSENEEMIMKRVYDDRGELIDLVEVNFYTKDTTPMSKHYFATSADRDPWSVGIRVSATLVVGKDFFHGKNRVTVRDFTIHR